jgi:hypothetical protein
LAIDSIISASSEGKRMEYRDSFFIISLNKFFICFCQYH